MALRIKHTTIEQRLRSRTGRAFTIVIGAIVGFYALWTSSELVLADKVFKTAHIFGTEVSTVGWSDPTQVLRQELSPDATFGSFTRENSAYIIIAASTSSDALPDSPAPQVESEIPQVSDAQQGSTTPEAVPEESEQPTVDEPAPAVVAPEDTAEQPVQQTQLEVLETIPVETTTVVDEPVAETIVETSTTSEELGSPPENTTPAEPPSDTSAFMGAYARLAFSMLVPTASASTTDEHPLTDATTSVSVTTPPIVDVSDIALCTTLGKECHTIEISGFTVAGDLLDKNLRKASLSFSFAHVSPESDLSEDRLVVRYFHNGTWREGGEVYLNKEISNATNGGYFSSSIDEVSDWTDLNDIKVVVEYDRGAGSAGAELYLDAIWIDADYKERIQDVVAGNIPETPAGLSDNVSLDLALGEGMGPTELIAPDGGHIAFNFIDDLDEDTLEIRADKNSYHPQVSEGALEAPLRTMAHISITNTGTERDSFRLAGAFLAGGGTLVSVEQFLRNVPVATTTHTNSDVTYLCESRWQSASSTDDASAYRCSDTADVRHCAALSESGENCTVADVVIAEEQTRYKTAWVPLGIGSATSIDEDVLDGVSAGYVPTALSDAIDILPGQTVYLRLLFEGADAGAQRFALFALGEKYTGDFDTETLQDERIWRDAEDHGVKQERARVNDQLSARTSFDGDELPEFKFKFKTQRSIFERIGNRLIGRKNGFAVERTELRHVSGKTEHLPFEVEYGEGGEWTLALKKQPRTFRPGKYTLELKIQEGAVEYTDTVEFYWGVLVVNTNKTIYVPNERADLFLAALDDSGNTICNAVLDLVITNPAGGSQNIPVRESGSCGPNNVTDIPDYLAEYDMQGVGTYSITLTHLTETGEVLNRASDSFEVREEAPFVVERTGPTRIWPKAPYTMDITVTANRDFSGRISEYMPQGFILLDMGGGELNQYGGDILELFWGVSMQQGETRTFRYEFDAPDVSPYIYVLGPLAMKEGNALSFEETRTWKIASDALGNYIEKKQSWSPTVANTWEAKDLSGSPFNVPANAIVEIAIVNSDPNNEQFGGVRHASSSLHRGFLIHEPEPQGTTEFVMHVQASATSSIQTVASSTSFVSFVLLGYWTSGYYVERFDHIDPNNTDNTWGNINLNSFGVASGTVAEMVIGAWHSNNTSLTGGVRSGTSTRSVAIHESEAGGVNGVTMLVKASTTNATIQGFAEVEGTNNASIDYWLAGYWSQNPTGLDYTERYDTLTGPTSGSTWTDTALNSFSVPSSGIAEVLFADTAAANLSQLLGVRTDGSSIDRSFNIHEAEAGGWSSGKAHVKAGADANATIELYTDDTANDAWRLTGYWAASNTPATDPTLYDYPFESEKTGTSTPKIRFSSSDPDGSSSIVYQIQWDDDATLDDSPIGDRISSDESGCSPNCFQNLTTPADTSPFNENEQIEFSIQTALVSGTTYYWRTRAYDVSGSNIASEWSTTTSFTYIANTNPAQWFQTQDTQFDTGALSGTQTYGSNAVRLTTSAPTGALMAYGEGTVQTPRYRVWNGTAWGTEGSAQSVGGTILWTITKAGITRDEYVVGTLDDQGDVNVQVYNGGSATWGNLQEVTTSIATASTTRRGFDVAYESTSGDAIVAYCDGDADPSYYVWNGSTWTSGGTINLSSTHACEWVKLASDPVSDEIILVSRDTGAGSTDYEAQVWNGSSWGNALPITGSGMTDTLHEGISVEYEESGDQAVVAVSNGDNPSLWWAAWDGTNWNTPTTQSLGNDFEWGTLKQDDGSDNMALCYADQSDDLGVLRWDGSGWSSFQEFELTANVGAGGQVDGRTISCEFETTTGRDGYLMIPYTDTTNARYVYMDDATGFSTEASISTIQDSWTVQSVRTGEGKILVSTHDDQNGRYDESYWNGSTWSTASTLENTPSDTSEPFGEPISMAAQIYVSSSGTIISDPVDFDWVPGRSTWGEALLSSTEVAGTDVKLQIMYTSAGGSSCASLVPDGDLAGNSSGFDASQSPVNLTALSTSTYNRLCLKATLSSTNQSVPTLDDWTINWQRKPYLTQSHYRWYVNTNTDTPTDPWPSGGTDIPEDTAIASSYSPPGFANVLRLRMSVLDSNVALSSSALTLRLQYAEGATCSASMTWIDVGAIGSTTAKWRGYNNASVSDGATLPSVVLSTADTRQSYEEENDATANPLSVAVNDEGEWDWVLEQRASSTVSYCFRAITSDNDVLNAYSVYPALITNSAPGTPTQSAPFDNEKTASTTPYLEFAADDPESNDITYQIQLDNDYDFSSTVWDANSQINTNDFTNIITTSDKDPFTSGQTVRFSTTTALSNGTTYYWRVRGKDRNASTDWSSWSDIRSITIDTSITISTWHQTRLEQFSENSHEETEATSTNDVVLTPPATVGTTTGPTIDYDWKTGTANAWGSLTWTDDETTSDIKYSIEYLSGGTWALIPDADLAGNSAGFDTSGVSLLGLSPTTYNQIRIRAVLTNLGSTPRLNDWTISWGLAVSQPTLTILFDNEKTGTTTPSFRFASTDPQNEDLEYEFSWSQTTDFTASTTRNSGVHAGFTNIASSTDTSPFASGSTTQFKIQQADATTNGNTYWWRVRARDPNGSNVWSTWSSLRSFTVDTTIVVSTWFQTTDDQFETDTLTNTEASGSGSARITTTIREAFTAYAEGTVQAPRYRIWNGSAWGSELTAESTGVGIRFVEAAAAPTRDEYVIVTEGTNGIVKAQIYNGSTGTTGNLVEINSAVPDATQRGFDVAYETTSGDAIVVSCGTTTEAVYRVWNGSSWAATSSISLSTTGNCEWVKLASNPTSDELIMVARGDTSGVTDYEAQVWSGSTWGNSTTTGSQATANNEGIALEYEESGGQALMVVSDGANNQIRWAAWNGSNWNTGGAATIGGVFAGGRLARDSGSDELALCLTDTGSDNSFIEWSGSSWGTATEFELTGNSQNGRPISCEYETTAGRDNYVMIPSSDTAATEYTVWDTTTPPPAPVALSTIGDAWELRTTRTGDGNILLVAYDDASTQYDFSYWNGSTWSTAQTLETDSIATVVPATIPIDIVARRYTSVTSGSVTSPSIAFSDGSGPKWENALWNDTTTGGSDILYQVEYYTSTSSWAFIPTTEIPGNNLGTTTSPIDLSNVDKTTYSTLRLKANFTCGASCPTLNDWTLAWSEGIDVSGTAQQFDQSTNVTSGTVAIAVNGDLQVGKTGTISAGAWTIPNVTVFSGDVVTVFIEGAADENEAVAVAKYDGNGDIAGIPLYERHLTIGSSDNQTITNANLSQYDNGVSGDEDVFHEVTAGNDLSVCYSSAQGCFESELFIKSGNTYRPDSASGGDVSTRHIEINGTMTMDGNAFNVSGSWDNNGTTTANTSTVTFTATSTTETFDTTGAAVAALNNVVFGSGSGTATWNLSSALDVDGNLSINYGRLNQNGSKTINIAGNLSIGSSGLFTKGTASTTFDGSGSSTWTDNSSPKQDMGTTTIDGSTKTITLGSAVKTTNLYIGADDTFDVSSGNNYALEVAGNFTNNNVFQARAGTVTFSAISAGKVIKAGSSSFYGMTFNGSGGNWSFNDAAITVGGDFIITLGTVAMPTGTTTITGSFTNSDTFMHNNGAVLFNASGSKTITASTSPFYALEFNGSGSWSFSGNATSSQNTAITAGSVTLPSGTFAVAGSFQVNGGSFTHNSGTLKFTATAARVIKLNNSSAYNMTFDGSGGSWSFTDANATSTNTVRFDNGSVTLPSSSIGVGGSWLVTSGSFTHNSGTVRFTSTDTGETIDPAASTFYNLIFDGVGGGWTILQNATSTASTTITRAASFTLTSGKSLEVGGQFTNLMGGATTTWTGSTLFLNSGTSYALNASTTGGDGYGTLMIGANTDVKMWNSSSTVPVVNSTGSLYSQDHSAQDGDLYIWGEYVTTNNEYWSYATDFDGTALSGGNRRQVDVRVASGASITASSTVSIVGDAAATTTIANQGSGSYSMRITGGTLNAQYYSFTDTDTTGLWLTGVLNITSLANGDFTLSTNAGNSLTVESSVIDRNPAIQIQQVSFATSSGITSGSNVRATSTPSSYWWFRNHYGNFAGEANDSDVGGNPGNIRWDDSSLVISISGVVYTDQGTTTMGAPTCNGSANNVRIVVSGASGVSSYEGSCDAGTGAFSIPGITFSGDVVVTTYLNTNGLRKAVSVTKTPAANITNMHLYENSLVVRHEDVTPITIEDLAWYDSSDDADIFFTAATTSTDTLTTQPNTELYIWSNKTFAPNGNVTLESGGSGDGRDGRLYMATSSTFTAAGTETHSIGGGFTASSSATFTPANSTVTFTATTSGQLINAQVPITFYNLTFNGAGATWSLSSTATTTVSNTFAMTAGTLSGTGNIAVSSGALTGNGTISMTGGTVELSGTGNLGSNTPWQFNSLTLTGASATTTKTGTATTTILGVLRVASSHVLKAGSGGWNLSGSGTPFVVDGTFTVDTAPFYYTATAATNIADETYSHLVLAPSGAGSPTYTIMGGTLTATTTIIGNGTNGVTVTADTNDPSMVILDDLLIQASATLTASSIDNGFQISGSWTNQGTFNHTNTTVLFNSTDTGETIDAGGSPFYNLTFNNSGGGWTITQNATSSNSTTLTNANSFAVSSGKSLEVRGTFTNSVGGSATTWSGSTLYLNSGTSYSANAKTVSETYGNLLIGANTDVKMWNSTSTITTVDSTGSLYSQDHNSVDGSLYIWGDYVKSSGSDYWSYETDFDGTTLSGGSVRQVNVRIASSSTVTSSGGVFDILGTTTASTTIAVQGTGRYSVAVSGGTFNASYYQFRNLDQNGLQLSGSPTVTNLSSGDFESDVPNGNAMMTVAGSVIDQNQLKTFTNNRFATSTEVATTSNVTVTGTSVSTWNFDAHYGNRASEAYDVDPAGDPGYVRWDDSASAITISGNVYANEGYGVSSVCDGTTLVVRLLVEGGGTASSTCNASTGAYSISDIFFNPGETITVFLNTNGGARAANITEDPVTNISNMHLYENRVIVRHEDTSPLTIADMTIYDSDQDSDIPFDAEDAATDTLTLPPEKELFVWDGKTFAPAGNVTLESGGSGAIYDGRLHLGTGATFSAASTQAHSVGGGFLASTSASLSPANSTFTFTATTTGKTITPQNSSFYNITFNGAGGNWAFSGGNATSTNNFTITNGTVTLPTGTTTVGSSFSNTGGTFMHNNGVVVLTSTATGKDIRTNGSSFYNLYANGSGGAWTIQDTNATTSNNFTIVAGTVTLASGTTTVGSSFDNQGGTVTHNSGTVRFTATAQSKVIRAGGSNLYNVILDGVGGGWRFLDTNATIANNMHITNGSTTLPTGILTVGGSFVNAGVFEHASGTVKLTATATGKSITANGSKFYNLTLDGSGGGWTMTDSATTTNNMTLTTGSGFTLTSGTALEVQGIFTNAIGGSATTWTGSTLYLNGATTTSINTKSAGGDGYGTLLIGANSDISMWNSSSTVTTVDSSSSLYSQDHSAVDGDLYIWGEYIKSSGTDYWSRATDFDGTDISGSPRTVNVKIATSSTLTYNGGTLNIVGAAGATTTVDNQGVGRYALAVSAGTLNAQYYQFRNLDQNGLALSGSPTVTSLSNGDFEMSVPANGTMITVAAATIDANASKQIASVRFATSSGVVSGYNVTRTGSPASAWTFTSHHGDYAGEAKDSDGGDACGNIRWSDSSCLFVSQEHYRWRNDDGGEGAPSSEWYDASWSKRKKIGITNNTATSYTDLSVKVVVDYDADMQSDFDDLRFTDSSGTTSINFWRERYTASASSTMWVKVPSLPASGSATVYMYYGNGSAANTGSGTTTFQFFDDFEDAGITEYSGSDTAKFAVGTTYAHNYTYGLDASPDPTAQTTNGIRQTGSLTDPSGTGDTIRFFTYVDSTQDDEPCTLFGVQGSGQNYAVCLDQFPSEAVVLAKNVTSNDGSGTSLTSSAVTFTTGWYEVEVDWRSSGTRIDVTVYDANGSVFTTLSSNDTTYTSAGGVGFTFWGQHGGWDFYSVRDYISSDATYVFGQEQGNSGATWMAAEDTVAALTANTNTRLRFSVQNTGAAAVFNELFRLQFAQKGAALSCEAVADVNYSDVPVYASCGSSAVCMATSTQFADGDTTAGLLSYPASLSFSLGKMVEDTSNQTASSTIAGTAATEVEYVIKMTDNASASAYCLRVRNGAQNLDNYSKVAEMSIAHTPTLSNFTFNSLQNITLTEGASTTIHATGTVTDLNGYADLTSATSTMYRSGVSGGAACTQNENNCYQIVASTTASACAFTNCSGNSCTLDCRANIQYIAEPTDVGSTYAAENWFSRVQIEDSTGRDVVETSPSVDLLTLYALSVNTNIAFPDLYVGEDTGATNAQTVVTNTGNTPIDIRLSGTSLSGSGTPIAVGEQKFATSTFTYASCSICTALTGSATPVEVDLPKPTATTSPITEDVFWGLNVPVGSGAGLQNGVNYFEAVSD